jgi:hypothetical protein
VLATSAFALLGLAVLGIITERLFVLCFRAPLSDELLAIALKGARESDDFLLRSLVERNRHSHCARLVEASAVPAGQGEDTDATLQDLRSAAGARLSVLRTLATLCSSVGLLAGILTLGSEVAPEDAGLLALKPGMVQRVALAQALRYMAAGVGLSGLAFYGLGRLRRAALGLIRQDERLARALRTRGE